MTKDRQPVAQQLTYAGILPFLGLSVAIILKLDGYDFDLALRAYGAVIVSFLCGVHWATALLISPKTPRYLLYHSNAIALVAWCSVMFSWHRVDLFIQAVCLMLLLKLDDGLLKQQIIPRWYFSLRRNATVTVVVIMISTAYLS